MSETAAFVASIGLGVDTEMLQDGTTAACRAVSDALHRSVWNRELLSKHAIRIQLGVPNTSDGIYIHHSRVMDTVRGLVTVKDIPSPEVVAGGLHLPTPGGSSIGAIVACVSLDHTSQPAVSVPWNQPVWAPAPAPEVVAQQPVLPETVSRPAMHHSTSIEMLARISTEMIDGEQQRQQQLQWHQKQAKTKPKRPSNGGSSSVASDSDKPSLTPNKNKRLYVKHEYEDRSTEHPTVEEYHLVGPQAPPRTPNAAFPLKLHELLTEIERDGHQDILGWMPHGRSFKIFNQQRFSEVILPKYFNMTKKSSFLRQLNLYNFNRISMGPDQGSYYHEFFLKGMKFLCRRIVRHRINGNGIRAAANPDDEPVFTRMPPCPPKNNQFTELVNQFRESGRLGDGSGSPSPISMFTDTFPLKLQRALDKMAAEKRQDIIHWCEHGRAFIVEDQDRLCSEILPKYFQMSKYPSFVRQLGIFAFKRVSKGDNEGAFYHDSLHRGRPDLAQTIHRVRMNGRGSRGPIDEEQPPDFASLPEIAPIEPGTKIDIPPMGDSGAVDGQQETIDV